MSPPLQLTSTADLFIADIIDAAPKGDLGSMEHPIFSLSKRPDREIRHYDYRGISIDVEPSAHGIANIWDKDLLIYCCSQIKAGMNAGREPSDTVQMTAYDFLVATRGKSKRFGSTDYKQVKRALERLAGTRIKTNIATGGVVETHNFGLIVEYKIIEDETRGVMTAIAVRLPAWLYRSVVNNEVLTLSREYFHLNGGLARRVYEIARKHCGHQYSWDITLPNLYVKTGSQSPMKKFRFQLSKIEKSNELPEYFLIMNSKANKVHFVNRAKAKEDMGPYNHLKMKLLAESLR